MSTPSARRWSSSSWSKSRIHRRTVPVPHGRQTHFLQARGDMVDLFLVRMSVAEEYAIGMHDEPAVVRIFVAATIRQRQSA